MKLSLKLSLMNLTLALLPLPVRANWSPADPHLKPAVLSTTCTQDCFIQILPRALCSTADPAPCLCTNFNLQEQLGKCVFFSCQFYDQMTIPNDLATLCEDYPRQTRSGKMVSTAVIMTTVTFCFITLRVLSRWLHQRRLWADDWIALIVFILTMGGGVLLIQVAGAGFGNHYWNARLENFEFIGKRLLILQSCYSITVSATKISILVFYHRVLVNEKFQTLCKWSIGILILPTIVFFWIIVFQCVPVSKLWNPTTPGTCLDIDVIILWGAILSIIEDLAILIMPVPLLSTLNIGRYQTLNLLTLFACASFACVTSVLRLKFAIKMVRHDYDKAWDLAIITIWSAVEVDVMLICACLPAIRPLLVRFLQCFSNPCTAIPGPQPPIINDNRIKPMQETEDFFLGDLTKDYLGEVKDRIFLDDYTESSGNSFQTPARRPSEGYFEGCLVFPPSDDWILGDGNCHSPGEASSDQSFFAKYMQRVSSDR